MPNTPQNESQFAPSTAAQKENRYEVAIGFGDRSLSHQGKCKGERKPARERDVPTPRARIP